MTEEDARLLHEKCYGVPPGMMIECVGTECKLVPVPMREEKLVIPLVAVATWIIANKLVPNAKYALGIVGAVPGRRVSVKFGKGLYLGYADPIFRECIANARGECLIEATGREIAEAAKHRKMLVGSIPLMSESGNVTVSMYAQEDRRMLQRDIRTPIQPVTIHIASRSEELMRSIPCFVPPRAISAKDAADGFAVGKPYYIKFATPLMCCLPGLPYTPGMWVPFGFVISENP
jgi:hypothetical protein